MRRFNQTEKKIALKDLKNEELNNKLNIQHQQYQTKIDDIEKKRNNMKKKILH